MSEDTDEQPVSWWVDRIVTAHIDGEPNLGPGVVLAVDDTPYRPSAWVKFCTQTRHPMYRSVDLCDLTDVETDEQGPCWGTGGGEADAKECLLYDGLSRPYPVRGVSVPVADAMMKARQK